MEYDEKEREREREREREKLVEFLRVRVASYGDNRVEN